MPNIYARQRQIEGTSSEWAASDLILGDGELAIERQNDGSVRAKVGNGALPFSAAPYLSGGNSGLIYRGEIDPTGPPPPGAEPGDLYSARPAGVVAPAWGEPAAGESLEIGDLLALDAGGSWNVIPGTIDPAGFVLESEIGAPGGAAMVGFQQAGTGAVPRTALDKMREVVSVKDFGVLGDGVTDDTAKFQAAINYVRDNGLTLFVPGATYLVGQLVFDGAGYAIDTVADCLFKQKAGLTGDGNIHPIWAVTGSRIRFGDASFEGNIASDVGEWSHAAAFGPCNDITAGVLHGKDLRGDVVYVYGRISTEAERTRGLRIAGITGDNILRCILAVAGGEGSVGFVRRVGSQKVGYKDVDFEPNASTGTIDDYQPVSFSVGHLNGATVQCVSADADVQNLAIRFDAMELDGALIANSAPPYSGFAGVNDFAISVQNVKMFDAGAVILKNYQYSPIFLGDAVGTFAFDRLEFANVSIADATYNTLILHRGSQRPGLVRGGEVKGTHFNNHKMVFRSDVSVLNIAVDRVDVVGGCFGANITGRVGTLKLDCGATGDGVFTGLAGFHLGSGAITNAASAIGFVACANCVFQDTSATFGTLNYGGAPSTNLIAINSAINGALVPGINALFGAGFYISGVAVTSLPTGETLIPYTLAPFTELRNLSGSAGLPMMRRVLATIIEDLRNFRRPGP